MNSQLAKYFLYYPVVYIKGENVRSQLARLAESQWLSLDLLQAIQHKRLQKLISYAKRNNPYYREHLAHIEPDETGSYLGDIPFLTKQTLIDEKVRLVSRNRYYRHSVKSTGGSTGEPVTVYKDRRSMAMERAALWRGYSWAGVGIGDPQGRFWGMPFGAKDKLTARLIDFVSNRYRVQAFEFTESTFIEHYQELMRFRPKYLYGYVSLIELFGQFMSKHGLQPPASITSIITTAEVLTQESRESIEHNYGVKAYNEYGSGEMGTIAHECEAGKLHICMENVLVEIVDGENKPCAAGERGELVVTELNNTMLPLIRYRIGDFAQFDDEPCACGRKLTVLKEILGRAYDIVHTSDGRGFHPAYFNYVFKEVKKLGMGVRQFQIVQSSMDRLDIKIIPGSGYSDKAETLVAERIRSDLGQDIVITYEIVKEIPRERSGKFRVVKGFKKPTRPLDQLADRESILS
jgi:phenylacetate-CoA ligase